MEDHSDRRSGTCDVLAAAIEVTSSAAALGDGVVVWGLGLGDASRADSLDISLEE